MKRKFESAPVGGWKNKKAKVADGGVKAKATGWRGKSITATDSLMMAKDYKFVDTAATVYNFDTTGSVTHISIVPTGTSVNAREGKNFKCNSVQIRGQAISNAATTYASGMALLVWDAQPNKALAAVTDILDTNTIWSFIKRENQQRFRILKKWRYDFAGNSVTPTTGDEIYDVDDFVRLPTDSYCACTSADTTGAIGNRISGALLLLTTGDKANGTTAAQFVVGVRTNFTDI